MKFAHASGSRPLDGYTIKRGIGIGGFGEVYFATSDAGKEVALKRIQRNLDIELRGVSQCLNLKHVNLISLFDIRYDDQGQGWVVMEYVGGESLRDVIERNPNGMPLDEVNDWFQGIAAGVAYLHDHGIVHRDLKPGNVFHDDGIVKIGDYGLSKFISCSRRSGQTESVGTFHYMAPEIGNGIYGKEIDVYALGIILYEMLTGQVPFDGESSQEIIMKHLTADPDLNGIAQPYRDTIKKALAKDPSQRLSNVAEMLAALRLNEPAARDVSRNTAPQKTAVPPVRRSTTTAASDVLYIGEDEDIIFGPVRQVAARPVQAQKLPQPTEEPIARAIGRGFHTLQRWFNDSRIGTPAKIVLLVAAVLLLVLNAEWLIPAGVVFGLVYLVYFGIRSLALATGGSSGTIAAAAVPRAAADSPSYNRRLSKQELLRQALIQKSPGEQLTELTGSLLMSAAVAAVLCLLMVIVGGQFQAESVYTWTMYAWLTLTSIAGAWTLLALGKLWERSQGDDVRRRFAMLVSGLAVGAAAFAGSQLLLIDNSGHLTSNQVWGPFAEVDLLGRLQDADGSLSIAAYLIYFAGLFAILRWWRQADPLRGARFSLWATAICVLWALILPFAQPWGLMLAATTSVAVQLSSPWMNSKERAHVRQQCRMA